MADRPNILLVVSDQERERSWLPDGVELPARDRLRAEGIELAGHHTHSSPCSPSRASLFSGRYVPQHGVNDNVIWPDHTKLDPDIGTVGQVLRGAGYRTAYKGKWHLEHGATPDMESYGFGDWEGNDLHYMGWAGTGVAYDPLIAEQAVGWLDANAAASDEPWFLTVALVNPHDVMWFPIDQPGYKEAHPDEVGFVESLLEMARWRDDEVLPIFRDTYDSWFDELPANFHDDLWTKPAVQRQWLYEQQHNFWGFIDPEDHEAWRRHLDYYVKLHQMGDQSLASVLDALDRSGQAEDTIVIYTSDHGDMCGSHGLRAKGPFLYEEIMHIPLYIRAPGRVAGGTVSTSLTSSVDVATTICRFAGVEDTPSMAGVDLQPLLADPSATVRDHVLFALDSPWFPSVRATRYASRGIFDGRFKYGRYYGVGGGVTSTGEQDDMGGKLFGVDARFEDHDHELYDLQEDPGELVNLANDRGRRGELRAWFDRLLEAEAESFGPLPHASI